MNCRKTDLDYNERSLHQENIGFPKPKQHLYTENELFKPNEKLCPDGVNWMTTMIIPIMMEKEEKDEEEDVEEEE